MPQSIVIGWSEVLTLIGTLALIAGVIASYQRISLMRAMERLLDRKLQAYLPTRELELTLRNLELRLRHESDRHT